MIVYGYKVFVSTVAIVMAILIYLATCKAGNQSGKKVAYAVIITYLLCITAIWG